MKGSVAVLAVTTGPAGLVAVKVRLEDGTVRRLVMPKRMAGVAEIEWTAVALSALTAIRNRPT